MPLTKITGELNSAMEEFAFQNKEKEKSASELVIANKELAFQNHEKEKRAAELIITNKELAFQNELLEFEKSDKEALINTTDDMMWSVNDHFNIIAVNNSLVKHLEGLSGRKVKPGDNVLMPDFFSDEVVIFWKNIYSRALHGEIFKEEMYTPALNNLQESWYETSFNPIYKDNIVVGCACYSRNITERKQTEQKLAATSHKLQQALNDLNKVMDSSLDVICAVSEDGRFLKVSAASEAVWGYKPEELIGKPIMDFVYHEDSEKTQTTAGTVMAGKDLNHFENRYIRKDGSLVPIEWTARWDEKDKIRYGVARNATQKKELEKAFEGERRRLNDLFTQAPTSMGILKGPNHIFEIANPLYLDLIGKKDIIGKPLCEVLPEIVEQGFIKILDSVYKTGESFSANEMLVKIDHAGKGELVDKYLNFIYQAYKDVNGNVEGIFFFAVDVTEQVVSRKKIEASERQYRNLFEQNLAGIFQSRNTGEFISCNEAFAKILKYDSPQELMNINASELYFSIDVRNNFIAQLIDQKKLYNYEVVLKCKDGTPVYVIENISLRKDVITGEEFFDGILIDITDRKNMEETLLQSERSLKDAQATAHVGSWELDLETQVGLWSDETCCIYGIALEENKQTYKDWLSFIHRDDLENVIASVNESQKTFSDTILNNRIILKDGTIKCIYTKFKYLLNENGNPTGLYGISHDVTEAKTAENELKKLSMIASETINGVVICDKNKNIVWANNAFTKMYGYELNEVLGKNPAHFLRGADTYIHDVEYIDEMILKKDPFSFEILNYKKNGDKIYIKVQVQFLFDDKGEIEQYFAIETDITRQKELEEKVEQEKIIKQKQITSAVYAAQENERSEIGRELHDNVNQLLSATRLYIDMARTNKEGSDALLHSASAYTLNAIEEIRKLSKTLITPSIKEVGFTDLVNDLAAGIMLIHPVQILFTANDFTDSTWNDKFQLNIFRIIQEQLNNILKHAHAKKILISIRECENDILVEISDDGIGFNTSKRTTGVGLTNIKSRSELFNGTVVLTSEPGKGTMLSITFQKTELTLKNIIKVYKLN